MNIFKDHHLLFHVSSFILVFIFFLGLTDFSHDFPVQVKGYADSRVCVAQGCHGPFVSCGDVINNNCTQEHKLGDGCRAMAKCEFSKSGECGLKNESFVEKCSDCVVSMCYGKSGRQAEMCESTCVSNSLK